MNTIKLAPKTGMDKLCRDLTSGIGRKVILSFIFILFLGLITPSFAQSSNNDQKKMKPDLLKRDFAVLKDSLEKLHGGLYRYIDKKHIEKLFKNCEVKLDSAMTLLSYYALVRYVISGIEDEHTSAFLPQDAMRTLITQAKFFPLIVRFIGNKAYVTCDTKGLSAGTEITEIDHTPIEKLRAQLFEYIPSDGSIKSGKYAAMNDGDDPFFYLYYLVYGEKPDFDVQFISPDGKGGNKQLQAEMFKDIDCHPVPIEIKQYLKLTYLPGDIAVLTIKSFLNDKLQKNNEKLESFLQEAFTGLNENHYKKLIIDVRDNGGGDDNNGALLDSYLTDKPFSYFASIKSNTRQFDIKDHEQLAMQQPNKNNFKGKVYILINGKCVSTTSDFCGIGRKFSNVRFVGEETGGGYYGNTSGARATVVLPNSQIKINVPLWEYANAVKKAKCKDRGTIPDYTIIPTINDFLQKKDVQMDFALRLAKGN